MNPLGDPYQVLADCPHCHTEAAVLQLMDPLHPACHLGVPASTRCRLCGHAEEADEELFAPRLPMTSGRCPACTKPLSEEARAGEAPCPHCGYQPRVQRLREPLDLSDPDLARRALARWAAEEGEEVGVFCRANMGREVDQLVAALVAGQPVGTSFDVIAYLFPAGPAGRGASAAARTPEVVDREPVEEEEAPLEVVEETWSPRTPARTLISVMLADGELRPGERLFIDTFLDRAGYPALDSADLRVWRPQELGPLPPPQVREQLVEAAVHLAHLDRERDGSEWKVISAYAAAWGITEAQLKQWDTAYDRRYATAMSRLWRSLSRLVRVH